MEPVSEDEDREGPDGDVLRADEVQTEGHGHEELLDVAGDPSPPESEDEGGAASGVGGETAPPDPKRSKKELSPHRVHPQRARRCRISQQ